MRLTKLLEDLDDKDTFRQYCAVCDDYPNILDINQFHKAHTESMRAAHAVVSSTPGLQHKYYEDEMAKRGYVKSDQEIPGYPGIKSWTEKPLKEDLDDKDEFTRDCTYCNIRIHLDPKFIADINDFHEAHTAARQAAIKVGYYATKEYRDEYESVMSKHGYQYGENFYWVKMLKEDIDDKDEFGEKCQVWGCYSRPDREEFHAAHMAASYAAHLGTASETRYDGDWNKIFDMKMNKHGYKKIREGTIRSYPEWVKMSVKEDIDDKDEFKPDFGFDPDDYLIEFWGQSEASAIMLDGAKDYGWVPHSSSSADQFEEIKIRYHNLYEAALDFIRRTCS